MTYFARRYQLERPLGIKYESCEIGEEAPTIQEAMKKVDEDYVLFIKKEKARLEKPRVSPETPFKGNEFAKKG